LFHQDIHTTHSPRLQEPFAPPCSHAAPSALGTQHMPAGFPLASHSGACSHTPPMRLQAGVVGQLPSPGFNTPADTTQSLSLQNPDLPFSAHPVPAGFSTQHISVGLPFSSHGGAVSHTVPSLLHIGVSGHVAGGLIGAVLMQRFLWQK
jgi:hypothetical protein